MVRMERALLVGLTGCALMIGAAGEATGFRRGGGSQSTRDPVEFQRPVFVDPPDVLLGSSGDGRCPTDPPNQPCLKDIDDVLFGKTFLQRTDDLVFSYVGGYGSATSSDSALTLGPRKTVSTSTVPLVLGARLFELPQDYTVVLFVEPGSRGSKRRGSPRRS